MGGLMAFFVKMTKYSDNLLAETIELWQPLSEKTLNEEDARQIIENITGFFSLLHEWEQNNGKKEEKA
jgi:hypothetical protein